MSTFELTPEEMELFLTESAEQVDTMEELLVTLEKGTDPDAVSAIFRAAHTLKGGAATAGMEQTARLTHALESLLDQVRNGQRERRRRHRGRASGSGRYAAGVPTRHRRARHGRRRGRRALVGAAGGAGGRRAADGRRRSVGRAASKRPAAGGGQGAGAPGAIRAEVDPALAPLATEAAAAGERVHRLPRPVEDRRGHAVHPPLSDFDDSRRSGAAGAHRAVPRADRRRRLRALAAGSGAGDGSRGGRNAHRPGRSVRIWSRCEIRSRRVLMRRGGPSSRRADNGRAAGRERGSGARTAGGTRPTPPHVAMTGGQARRPRLRHRPAGGGRYARRRHRAGRPNAAARQRRARGPRGRHRAGQRAGAGPADESRRASWSSTGRAWPASARWTWPSTSWWKSSTWSPAI